jgi:hypothetical protein
VYQPDINPFQIRKRAGIVSHTLVGVGEATTFTGFCSIHDADLFRPIDGNIIPTKQQSLLLHYRSLCRELYVKRPTIETNQLLRNADSGKPVAMQHYVQSLVAARDQALRLAVQELESDKSSCDKAILDQDYSDFVGCTIRFGKTPTLACAGFTNPVYDFSGRQLQDLLDLDKRIFNISFTLLPTDMGGILAFGWSASGDHVCRPFVSSLLSIPDDRKSDVMVQLIFDCCENHAIQPDWWDGLSEQIKSDLEHRFLNWADMNPVDTAALIPDSNRYADWEFEGVIWV